MGQGVADAMTTNTLTRADLTEAVFQAVGLSRNESAQMVEDMLEEVCDALARGETVKLSSFGTFAVRQKSQRMGRNRKTGDEVAIAPRRVLVFRPSHGLKAMINRETPDLELTDEGARFSHRRHMRAANRPKLSAPSAKCRWRSM